MLSEINQSEKDKYHIVHSFVESNEQNKLTNKIDQQHRDRLMDTENRLTAVSGDAEG